MSFVFIVFIVCLVNGGMIVNNELESIWKEIVVTSLEARSWLLSRVTEEEHKNLSE
jgi:hypoxanthine phosphoribosyltransferase